LGGRYGPLENFLVSIQPYVPTDKLGDNPPNTLQDWFFLERSMVILIPIPQAGVEG
jgi:hypothetical protein